ncbi:Protein of unknown function (DUF3558) [Prauserella flava]|nr:Protein of unknown function (DUF3558) [Prauserella flava]MCR3735867.1 Protein of unknown function (DUF3558) [Prauserella salsuginis]
MPDGSTTPAEASESPGNSSATEPGATPLTEIDPCSVLSSEELAKYGTFPQGSPENVGSARACTFDKDTDSPTTDPNRVITVAMRDQQGLDDAVDRGNGIERAEADGREYARIPSTGPCTIAIGVSATSRVDVTVVATEGTEKSCTIADEVAAIVEPRLPQD